MKRLRVTVNGKTYDVEVEIVADDDQGGSDYGFPTMPTAAVGTAPVAAPGPAPSAPKAAPPTSGAANELTSPLAGTIVEVKVKAGDEVKENQPLVVIEAMKMNTNVSSPVSGKIKEIKVNSGDNVQQGQVLITFE